MNRLILRYGYPLSALVLLLFAWVIVQRAAHGWSDVVVLLIAAVVTWLVGVVVLVLLWPRITVSGFARTLRRRGLGGGPVPVNTLAVAPERSSSVPGSLLSTGTDDLVYAAGWLDVATRPLLLHVPDTGERYYSLQFTDPATSADVAYVGTRTTGNREGEFLITGRGWTGDVPAGARRIPLPGRSALVIGRVHIGADGDREAAARVAQQLRLSPV